MGRMIDGEALVVKLQEERRAIDIALQRVMVEINQRGGRSVAPVAIGEPQRAGKSRKGHSWSPAKRAEMSKKLKAAWAKRRGAKSSTKG